MSELTKKELDELLKGTEDVPSNWVSWGKPGDIFKGTLLNKSVRENNYQGKTGLQTIYEFKGIAGQYHTLDKKKNPIEPPIIVQAGSVYNVGGRSVIDAPMKNVRPGTICVLHYLEDKASKDKAKQDWKFIKVRVGGTDPDYMGEETSDIHVEEVKM